MMSKERELELVLSSNPLSSPCLDLSRRAISNLPEEMTGCNQLECLYLEGNLLRSLPASFFSSCSNLCWLDLRNNHLTHLSPSIQLLRGLKTLLLQGNQLTSLPPELGRLRQLNGLSLASNPLSSPPPDTVRRGTGAVLQYLRAQLTARSEAEKGEEERVEEEEEEEEGEEGEVYAEGGDSSSENGDVFTNVSRQSIKKAALLQNNVQMQEGAEQQPLVILRPACIHPHPPPSSPSLSPSNHHHHHHHQRARGEQGSDGGKTKKQLPRVGRRGGLEMPPATQTEWQERDEREKTHVHHPLSQEEMLQANIAIEKQRSRERLERWRDEARLDHLGPPKYQPHTVNTAPYATEHRQSQHPEESDKDPTLLNSILRMPDHDREEVVRTRVQHYNKALQSQRRQAGLISQASSDLLEAERKLAEALAQRDEMDDRKKREYRLTAFTADPNLL